MSTFAIRSFLAAMLAVAVLLAPEVAAAEAPAPVTIKVVYDNFVKIGAGRVLGVGAEESRAESTLLTLPQGGTLAPPWVPMVSLADAKVEPEEAARFRFADDPKVGRALVVGPWLAGAWSARAQNKTIACRACALNFKARGPRARKTRRRSLRNPRRSADFSGP